MAHGLSNPTAFSSLCCPPFHVRKDSQELRLMTQLGASTLQKNESSFQNQTQNARPAPAVCYLCARKLVSQPPWASGSSPAKTERVSHNYTRQNLEFLNSFQILGKYERKEFLSTGVYFIVNKG